MSFDPRNGQHPTIGRTMPPLGNVTNSREQNGRTDDARLKAAALVVVAEGARMIAAREPADRSAYAWNKLKSQARMGRCVSFCCPMLKG
jgi:hypothetical protein